MKEILKNRQSISAIFFCLTIYWSMAAIFIIGSPLKAQKTPLKVDAYFQITPAAWGFGANYLKVSLEQWGRSMGSQMNMELMVSTIRENEKLLPVIQREKPFIGLIRPSVYFDYQNSAQGKKNPLHVLAQVEMNGKLEAGVCIFKTKERIAKSKVLFQKNSKLGVNGDIAWFFVKRYFKVNLNNVNATKYFQKIKVMEDAITGLAAVKVGALDAFIMRDHSKMVLQKMLRGKLDVSLIDKQDCIGSWPNALFVTNSRISFSDQQKIKSIVINPKNPAMKPLGEYLKLGGVKIVGLPVSSLDRFNKIYKIAKSSGWISEYNGFRNNK